MNGYQMVSCLLRNGVNVMRVWCTSVCVYVGRVGALCGVRRSTCTNAATGKGCGGVAVTWRLHGVHICACVCNGAWHLRGVHNLCVCVCVYVSGLRACGCVVASLA
jgi:hypothetical protein